VIPDAGQIHVRDRPICYLLMGNVIKEGSEWEVPSLSRRIGWPMTSRVLVHLEEGRAIELCAGLRMLMALMRFLWMSWYRRAELPIAEAFKMGPRRQ